MAKDKMVVTKSNDNASIHIDVSKIPDYIRDDIAAATLQCVKNFLKQPGGRETLHKRIEKKKAEYQSQ